MSLVPVIPFNRLSIDTDLTPPPPNWLRSTPHFPRPELGKPYYSGFSSFGMATDFPDSIHSSEAVDVISDGENIKKLLKIPYNPKSGVSMVVHRIGKTLLIDDFDIHRYLLRSSESDWQWLKKVILETVLDDKEKTGLVRKTPGTVQERNLISKFLYRSLDAEGRVEIPVEGGEGGGGAEEGAVEGGAEGGAEGAKGIPLEKQIAKKINLLPPLPEASPEDNLPEESPKHHQFARKLIWNFEDIRMLIGSDMPIFGDAEHPSVSLRLHNMNKPINILTGLDYWLDNLMCQVPEVLMCYHLDGIVQHYELHKTEDLPQLGDENSKFNPRIIRDVAQNILSFLRSNATKEGHTYWLFKAKDDEVVKLYDLTSLCDDFRKRNKEREPPEDEAVVKNPFRTAVSMLLYKVARNVMQSDQRNCEVVTIRHLLLNCLNLLDAKQFPQIATSAHFMLSDLYIPDTINPANPEFPETQTEFPFRSPSRQSSSSTTPTTTEVPPSPTTTTQGTNGEKAAVDIQSLCRASEGNIRVQPDVGISGGGRAEDGGPAKGLPKDPLERCRAALRHVVKGMEYLEVLVRCREEEEEQERKDQEQRERDNPKMSKPFEPIPMPYEENTDPKMEVCKRDPMVDQEGMSWHDHLKLVLLKKACLVYITMAEVNFSDQKFGHSLRCVKQALSCTKLVNVLCESSDFDKNYTVTFALGVGGDCYMSMVQNWDKVVKYQEGFNSVDEVGIGIGEVDAYDDEDEHSIKFPKDIEESMLLAAKCFRIAASAERQEERLSLLKRLGNVYNEIGVFYMNQAANLNLELEKKEDGSIPDAIKGLFDKSLRYLEDGIKNFEAVDDSANIALLNSNSGRLCRLYAFCGGQSDGNRTEFSDFELAQYDRAVGYYKNALTVISHRRNNPPVWDSITWELSCTLFTMGTLLQDYAPLSKHSKAEVEKQVTEYLHEALKYCDLENGPKLAVYQYRAGVIHHRLASMYHQAHRGDYGVEKESRRGHLKQLAERHYVRAANLFQQLDHYADFLRVQMERIGLLEFTLESLTSNAAKIKAFVTILELFVATKPILEKLANHDEEEDDDDDDSKEETDKMLKLFLERLQSNLLQLNKLLSGTKKKAGKNQKDFGWAKNLYSKSLRAPSSPSNPNFIRELNGLIGQVKNELPKLK